MEEKIKMCDLINLINMQNEKKKIEEKFISEEKTKMVGEVNKGKEYAKEREL